MTNDERIRAIRPGHTFITWARVSEELDRRKVTLEFRFVSRATGIYGTMRGTGVSAQLGDNDNTTCMRQFKADLLAAKARGARMRLGSVRDVESPPSATNGNLRPAS